MSDVFISYKREDEARVEVLQAALNAARLDVWWDKHIPGGYRWRQQIQSELESAKCVLVVWSEHSTGPTADIVVDEANRARRRGVLLQVRIDDVGLPLGFGEHQALELIGWNGNAADPRFQDLVVALKALVAGAAIPMPRALPRRKKGIWPVATIVVIALASALLVNSAGASKAICRISGIHGICSRFAIGGVPSQAEEALWSVRNPGDCGALSIYLERFPLGAYAAEANSRLQARRKDSRERWTSDEKTIKLFIGKSLDSSPSEQKARTEAQARASVAAHDQCAGYQQGEFRLLSARAGRGKITCVLRSGGYACDFDGEAICRVSTRHVDLFETCP